MPASNALDWSAEVTLVSQDGQKFKIKQYHLLSASAFFRDMLENPGRLLATKPEDQEDGIVLDMDLSSTALQLLLDLMLKKDINSWLKWSTVQDVVIACAKYAMDVVGERAVLSVREVIRKKPWAVFCLASRIDNLKLAREALAVMQQDPVIGELEVAHMPLSAIIECELSYWAGLNRTAAGWPSVDCTAGKHGDIKYKRSDWATIASWFSPLVA